MPRTPLSRASLQALALVLLAAALAEGQGAGLAPASTPAGGIEPAITTDDLRRHVAFLAADELRGREAGTAGSARAARYLAEALERAGVQPAGDDDGFLQAVPLFRYEYEGPPELLVKTNGGRELTGVYGADFSVRVRGTPHSTGPLPVRAAEELPEAVDPHAALFLDGSSRDRRGWLEQAGQGDGSGWGLELRAGLSRPGRARSDPPRSRLALAVGEEAEGCEVVALRGELRERLVAGELATVELRFSARRVDVVESNVVGRIPGVGTDEHPELADEAVVFSAHFDHLGVAPPAEDGGEDEDRIYNGADDDASGTAAVLELAEAFAAGEPPARTLVFLLATAEEKGLLGTRHYLERPAVPLERTVANLNFEMIGRPDAAVGGPGKLWLTGFEHTNLGPAFRAAGLDVAVDPRPEQNFYQRSDNYAFVLRGVIGQTLSSYDMHEDYHRVTDETERLDFDHMQEAVRLAYRAARLLSDAEVTPTWMPEPSGEAEAPRQDGR